MSLHYTRNAFIFVDDTNFEDYFGLTKPNLPFQFLDFESGVSDTFNPEFSDIPGVGRPAPFMMFRGNKARVVGFEALFFDEEREGEAFYYARVLQSLKLPWRRTDVEEPYLIEMFPPPVIRLQIAPVRIDVLGYLTKCDVRYSAPLSSVGDSYIPGPVEFQKTVPQAELFDVLAFGERIPAQVVCTCEVAVVETSRMGQDFLAANRRG